MDISDGLSSELMHICKQSNAGCRVYEEHIPIDYQTAVMAEEFNMNLTTWSGNISFAIAKVVKLLDSASFLEIKKPENLGDCVKMGQCKKQVEVLKMNTDKKLVCLLSVLYGIKNISSI